MEFKKSFFWPDKSEYPLKQKFFFETRKCNERYKIRKFRHDRYNKTHYKNEYPGATVKKACVYAEFFVLAVIFVAGENLTDRVATNSKANTSFKK